MLGTLGGLAMTWLFTVQLFVVMLLVHAPMVPFGPLTLAAVVVYARRRRG